MKKKKPSIEERAQQARMKREEVCAKKIMQHLEADNCQLVPMAMIGDQPVPVQKILNFKITVATLSTN